ncbi:MAG: penicillin acylase family protein [Candidatus Kapaibacterium sp.]|nr:MAG: penicillin acylase family protein [Candidatus Kapabacteria bacterium]
MKRFSFARRTPSHVVGILLVLLVLCACGALFSFVVMTRSAPKTNGSEDVSGIQGEVSLFRNKYGIVHLIATNDHDAYFGIGYAHAQDRLWQMDFRRRVAKGQLAALFGRSLLEHDMFLRTMRFDSLSAQLYRQTAPEARAALEAYTRGVNAYLTANKGRLAFEFDALDYEPDAWKPEDCLLLQRLWAWEMSSAFTLDLTLSALADSLGKERVLQLLPTTANTPYNSDAYYAPAVLDSLLPTKPASFGLSGNTANPVMMPLPSIDSLAPASTTASVSAGTVSMRNRSIHAPFTSSAFTSISATSISATSISALAQRIRTTREAVQMRGSAIGSNTWATRPSAIFHQETDTLRDTTTAQTLVVPRLLPDRYKHGALLANDLHTPFSNPAMFYEAHITSPSLNVVGFTLPGMPFVLSGRNDKCSWGIANMMLDDTDYFLETIDSADFKQYLTPSMAFGGSASGAGKEKFFFIADTIYVKDSSIAVLDARYTKRSCVVSDFATLQSGLLRGVRLRSGEVVRLLNDSVQNISQKPLQTLFQQQKPRYQCITFSWTGHYMSDDAAAYLRLNKAQNLAEARTALQTIGAPALNVALADTEGNIAMMPCGAVPVRSASSTHPNFFRNGADTNDAWQGTGVINAQELGSLINPTSGRVIAANNHLQRGTGTDGRISSSLLWDAPARAARASEYLQDFEHLSAKNMTIMQTDVVSHVAQMFAAQLVKEFSTTSASAQLRLQSEREGVKLLRAWNGEMSATSAAASIYAVFLERYAYNTLADELGEALYNQFAAISRLPVRAMLHLTAEARKENADSSSMSKNAWWFDNKATSRTETASEIMRQSYSEAIDVLLRRMNTDSVAAWQYGKLHTLTLRHPLSESLSPSVPQSIKNAVESRKYQLSGDAHTLFGSEWQMSARPETRFQPVLGSTARFVCDMQDTLVYVALAGGNSGEIFTKAASNQLPLWLNNVMIPLSMSREAHPSFEKRLVLVPITP